MASRILYNSAEEIDLAISGAYLSLIVWDTGLVRNTGAQNVSGAKTYYDTAYFKSGVGISGDLVPSGYIIGNLNPKSNNYYNLGVSGQEWANIAVGNTGRINYLHVDVDAFITGNTLVSGTITVGGTTTPYGDFIPTNIATNLLPKVTNDLNLGSNSQQFRDAWFSGTANIYNLKVQSNASVTGNLTVSGNIGVTGTISSVGAANFGTLSATSISTTGGYGSISGRNVTTTGVASLGVTTMVSASSTGTISSTDSGVFRAMFITGTGIPTSATGIGVIGQILMGSGYLYACTGTNRWGRTHLTGWT